MKSVFAGIKIILYIENCSDERGFILMRIKYSLCFNSKGNISNILEGQQLISEDCQDIIWGRNSFQQLYTTNHSFLVKYLDYTVIKSVICYLMVNVCIIQALSCYIYYLCQC